MRADNHDLRCLVAIHLDDRHPWDTGRSILLLHRDGVWHKGKGWQLLPDDTPFEDIDLHYVPDWPRNIRHAWRLMYATMQQAPEDGGYLWQWELGPWFAVTRLHRLGERAAAKRICQALLLAKFEHELVPWPA